MTFKSLNTSLLQVLEFYFILFDLLFIWKTRKYFQIFLTCFFHLKPSKILLIKFDLLFHLRKLTILLSKYFTCLSLERVIGDLFLGKGLHPENEVRKYVVFHLQWLQNQCSFHLVPHAWVHQVLVDVSSFFGNLIGTSPIQFDKGQTQGLMSPWLMNCSSYRWNCKATVNQHPLAHHPLDVHNYSVVDEPQLS